MRKKAILGSILSLFLAGTYGYCEEGAKMELDGYGGWKAVHFEGTGYFRTQWDGERWWLATPEGNAFLSIGICYVNPKGDKERGTEVSPYQENIRKLYGGEAGWSEATRKRLGEWGVNTMGAWSHFKEMKNFPYTIDLSLTHEMWAERKTPDFFDAAFAATVAEKAAVAKKTENDPWLIGYFFDNELPWSSDWRMGVGLFTGYLQMPAEAPGKKVFVKYFQEKYGTTEAFGKVWSPPIAEWKQLGDVRAFFALDERRAQEDRDGFALVAARQYFRVASEAVRAADQNHLLMGCRFIVQTPPKSVVKACGEYCDAVSINFYELGPMGANFFRMLKPELELLSMDSSMKEYFEAAGKPLMITEFGFRAMDSGLPNSHPNPVLIQPTVATQAERAGKYRQYAEQWMRTNYITGYHWFKYMDEPAKGRFDGEDGNYGFVNIADEPYEAFVGGEAGAAATNRQAWEWHRNSK